MEDIISKIDFDFWCNAKKEIVLILLKDKEVESISEMSRQINRSFSVTYRHIQSLKQNKIIKYDTVISLIDRNSNILSILLLKQKN